MKKQMTAKEKIQQKAEELGAVALPVEVPLTQDQRIIYEAMIRAHNMAQAALEREIFAINMHLARCCKELGLTQKSHKFDEERGVFVKRV